MFLFGIAGYQTRVCNRTDVLLHKLIKQLYC